MRDESARLVVHETSLVVRRPFNIFPSVIPIEDDTCTTRKTRTKTVKMNDWP